jgi:hypothetical protein
MTWFTSKAKNRRLGREHVLEVKLRSSKIRVARSRMAAVGLGAFFGIVLISYLLWCAGEWALNEFVYENKAFAIEAIDIQTDGNVAVDQLRRWAGLNIGDNLLALDMVAVRRRLEMIPLIQSAAIELIPPHSVSIRVIEREPVAYVNLPRPRKDGGVELDLFQIDLEGYVMQPLTGNQRAVQANPEQMPIIGGINPTEIQPGRRIQSQPVQAALALIDSFESSPMAGVVDFKRIDVSVPDVLVVTTAQGSEVIFGLNNPEQQLRRWREIHDAAQKIGKAVATLDLAIMNNVPARWLEASAVPLIPAKPAKTLHPRKKHV